ncbi:MAG TPA: hypothetical protein VJ843_05235, partial [Candidatus Saccharimonadales bacterium]|nr:hypothetical protein [Candidatus Saccharimonadales bacterium]
ARLMQSSGAIVPDGTYNVEFKLYNALTSSGSSQGSCTGDSACLWTETRTSGNRITVVNGYLTANLGSVTAFPGTINWDQQLYLSMNIGGTGTSATWDGEMSPRLQLTAVPYAFRAGQLATQNGSFTSTVSFVQPTANRSIQIPDESGAICLQNSTNCGFALSSGSGSYIQNGTSLQAGANFNISGTGIAATALQTPLVDTSTAAALNIGTTNATAINLNKSTVITGGISQSGGTISLTGNAASAITTSTGALTLTAAGTSNWTVGGTNQSLTITTSGTGVLTLGTTGAGTVTLGSSSQTINIGITNNAHTIHIGDGGTSTTQAITVGSTNGSSSSTIQGGTGSTAINLTTGANGKINLTSSGSGGVLATLGSGGFNIVSSTNSSTALAVQDASSSYIFSVSTSSGIVTMGAIQATYSGLDGTLNAPLGNITLGGANTTTIQGNSSSTFKGTSGSFTTTLGFTTPTANNAINLPNASGTICLQSSTSCGFAPTSGSANYIQNTTTAQSANMYVQAASSGTVAGVLRANAAGTGDILDLKNGAGTNIATFGSTGAVLLQNSTDSLSAFAINTSTGGTNENVFRVDTTNERVAIGVISDPIGAKLSVATSSAVGFRVYQGGSSDAMQAGNATADFFKMTNTGAVLLQNTTNSTAAFQIQNANATSNLFFADTTNTRIAIAKATASYTLDVGGDINSTTQLRVGGNVVCDSTGCTAKSGSGFYIHNQTTVQSANMYVQAATSGTVAAVLQANASGSGDILDLKNGAGTNVATFSSTGAVTLTNSTNSSSAFQVQNATGGALINVSTSTNLVSLNSGTAGLNAWASTSSMSTSGSFGGSVVMNGYVYNIGGYASAYSGAVRYAPIKANGTLGTWSTTTALGGARGYTAAASATGYLYVLGGTDGTSNQNTIYIAKQSADGTLSNWQTSPVTLPSAVNATAAYVANGYLYVLGGNVSGASTAATYYTHINGDGSINAWNSATSLPVALANGTTFAANGYLYYMGGINGSGTTVGATYYSPLNSDGSIGSWTSTTSLPTVSANFASVVLNGNVYMIKNSTTVSYAPLNSTGTIGTWVSDSNALPVSFTGMGAVTYNGYIYVMGGYNGTAGTTGVYYTSGARTMVTGSLDLVGATATGNLTGDGTQESGSVGGTLTAGNTTIVGTLQVQGQSNFSQNVAINGNALTVGNNIDSTSTGNTLITVQSRGFAGLELYGDSSNDNTAEGGGAYVLYSTDGILGTEAITGLVQQADIDPSGTTYTGAVANNMLVGTRSNFGLQFGTNANVRMVLTNGGNLCIALTSCTHKLAVNGQIYSTSATITTGTPDVSETISAAADVGAMDVVMADPNNTERVIKTTTPYNSAALGVVSDGTSGFQIDHLHYGQDNDPNDTTYRVPLTLAGRVYVKVSDENGAIRPGDYLTSSSTAGYAMRATKAGPTIGKALGFFDGDTGKVLVLVNVSYYDPATDIQGSTSSFTTLNVSGDAAINNLTVSRVTVSGDASVAGTLTAGSITTGTITINGHIITGGNVPSVQLQAAAGQDATISIQGNDSSGMISVVTGTNASADDLAKLTFATPYTAAPRVVLTPIGKTSAQAVGYVDQVDANGFMIGVTNAQNNQTYVFSYQVMQ